MRETDREESCRIQREKETYRERKRERKREWE